jgi:D-alanyl-D-alanine carboxypeptidase
MKIALRVSALAATVVLALGCGGGHSPQAHTASTPSAASTEKRLQTTLDRVRRQQKLPGAAAAVVFPDGHVWTGTSGLADVSTRQPVRADTLFAVASVTKTFIAALVLQLAEDGAVDLDETLSRWVPTFPNSRRISLRQLLSHTSGLADYVSDGRFLAAQRRHGLDAVWTPKQLLRYVPEPLAAPGERWIYSNTNFLLLGLVIERATHSAVGRELHRRLLPRATFGRIVFQIGERPHGRVAVGYDDLHGQTEHTANNPYVPSTADATSAWSSGNLLASAADLARAGESVLDGSLLSRDSLRQMTHWVKALDPPEYGLGLAHDELAGQEVWGHSGDITGFHADLWYLPKSRLTVAALTNYQAGPDSADKHRLAEELIADVTA